MVNDDVKRKLHNIGFIYKTRFADFSFSFFLFSF